MLGSILHQMRQCRVLKLTTCQNALQLLIVQRVNIGHN